MQIPITTQSNQISLKASHATASYTKAKEMGEFDILQSIISKAGANSIINLDKNYTYTEGSDTITEGIIIPNNNVTINGNGHAINATGKSRIFKITGENITLNNITFVEGQADNGGAIYWQSTNVNILDCYFINNTADYNGGANYFAGTLTNTTINGNYAGNTAEGTGGANYFKNTLNNVNINGNYTHNTAENGGANYFQESLINVNITGNYNNNTANGISNDNGGGANYFLKTLTNTNINGNYTGNIATKGNGGANHFRETLTNTNITGNYNHNTADDGGGANFFKNTLDHVNIKGNYTHNTAYMGGANYYDSYLKNVNMTGNYTNNTANGNGGANVFWDFLDQVNINGNYNHNSAGDGGANYFWEFLDQVNINGNYTHNTAQYNGGANNFWSTLTNTNINGNYNNNTAQQNGGANHFEGTLTNTNINGNYTDNTAGEGGANYFLKSLINVNITGNYNQNTANGSNDNYDPEIYYCAGGGANYFDNTLTKVNITGNYTQNKAETNGGANLFRNKLTNVTITGNYAGNTANGILVYLINGIGYYDGGGANYFQETLTSTTITGNYTHNTAQFGGANIFWNLLDHVNINGNYTGNTATYYGGANIFWNLLDHVNINGNYTQNTAEGTGGANYFQETLNNTNMNGNYTGNTATYYGGANYFNKALTNVTINGNYTDNTARNGGANYFWGTLTNVNITGNYNNTANGTEVSDGGGANNFNKALTNVTITGDYNNNTAQNNGGANLFGGALNHVNINGNYNNNTANGINDNYDPEIYYCAGGGANYFDNTLTNVNITGNYTQNKAETNGGANLFRNKLTNVTITGNYAGNTANGILVYHINGIGYYDGGGANNFQETLTSTTITGNYTHNTAQFGGANIFWNLLDHVNINGNYNHNTADEGGANYFQETLNNTNINGNYNNNTASDRGGANYYYNELNNVNINGNYNYNTAYEGGANYYLTDIFNTNINGNYNYNSAKRGGANYHYLSAIINTNITGNYINNTGTSAIDIFESESSTIRDSIFLNNVANIKLDSGDITLINNWFGNNASNYNETPNVENIDLDNWLFLNATVDYDAFAANPTANVTFALYSFNSKTNETSYYDAGQMSPIKLSITANQGKVNQSVAGLGETVTYTPDTVGKAIVTAAFESAKYEIELNIIKYNSSVTIKTITDGVYNTTAPTVDYEVTNETTVIFTINNSSQIIVNRPIAYLESELSKLNAGTYEITIINAEGGYHGSNATGQFTVYRAGSSIKIAPIGEATYGSNTTIGFTVTNSTEVSWKILNRNDTSAVDSGSGLDNISKAYPAGEYTIQITNKESINYNASSAQMNFTVKKAGSLIVIDDIQGVSYGNNVTVKFNVTNATAVTYAVKTKDGKTIIKNKTITSINDLILTGLEPGQYTITIANAENANYTGDVKSKDFTITKANSAVSIKAIENVRYKNNVTIRYSIENRTENVTVTVDGVNDTQIIITQDTITVTDLNAGNYTIRIANAGNELYNSSEDTKAFTVNRADPIVNVTGQNITYGQTENVHVEVPVDATGNVTVKLDGKFVSNITSFTDGKVDIPIYSLKAGNYTVEAIYSGDDNYNPASCSDQITVAKVHPDDEIMIDANVTVATNSTVEITLPENATGNVTVKVDNKTQATSDVENGTAKVSIPPQKAGNHTIEILYSGDDNYLPANKTEEITVYKENATAEIEIPTDIKVGDNTTVEITLPEDATGTVTLKVDGKTQDTAQLTNGSANLTIPPQKAGNHTIEIAYTGDDKYNPANKTDQITVSKNNATENIEIPENATFNEDASVNVTLPGDATGTVTLKVDSNVIDTVDVSNGTASIRLPKLAGGNHTAEITYSGDEKYNPSAKTETFTVASQTTQLSTANVTATYKTGKNITITLKDAQGNPIGNATVSVEINDIKNYTTDENGQINISTASLAPDTYNVKIAYAGNENYTQTDAEAKVVVKKASSKITAKKKTFKDTDKTKKYTITLKDNKGRAIKNAKVTLKVNRKTYTAKTNSKGKATFKLKKLSKKGKYNAVIKFKGNKYYTKSTKKVKLTVKDTFKTVKRGSKAVTTVKKIQKALKSRGYYTTYNGRYLMVDGKYEVYTEMAVKQFQKANGLKVTGSVDYNTAKKLKII